MQVNFFFTLVYNTCYCKHLERSILLIIVSELLFSLTLPPTFTITPREVSKAPVPLIITAAVRSPGPGNHSSVFWVYTLALLYMWNHAICIPFESGCCLDLR